MTLRWEIAALAASRWESAELHVYSKVGHGFGMRDSLKGPVAGWPMRFYEWMGTRGYLKPLER